MNVTSSRSQYRIQHLICHIFRLKFCLDFSDALCHSLVLLWQTKTGLTLCRWIWNRAFELVSMRYGCHLCVLLVSRLMRSCLFFAFLVLLFFCHVENIWLGIIRCFCLHARLDIQSGRIWASWGWLTKCMVYFCCLMYCRLRVFCLLIFCLKLFWWHSIYPHEWSKMWIWDYKISILLLYPLSVALCFVTTVWFDLFMTEKKWNNFFVMKPPPESRFSMPFCWFLFYVCRKVAN